MKKLGKVTLFSVCMLAFMCSLTFSQSQENGAIEGKVVTPEGEGLPGVEITISSPSLIRGTQSVVTSNTGKFRFVALLPGTYEIEAKLGGFNPQKKEGVRLSVGMTLTVDFVLTIGMLSESVEVLGVAPLIDVKDSQTSVTNMSKEFLNSLPLGRDVGRLITLAPGTIGTEDVSRAVAFGGNNNGVMFQVDGVGVNNPEGGVLDTDLDFNTIEEVNVMGLGSPAEYDGFNGLIMNTITKSGGNNFHGIVDLYGGLGDWVSDNSDDPDMLTTFRDSYQAHFSLGGPAVKDKLWFYSAVEYSRSRGDIEDMEEDRTGRRLKFFGKFTWQLSPKDRISSYFQYLNSESANRDLGPWMSPEAAGGESRDQKTFNLSWLHIFSDRTFLEAKFSGFDWLIKDIASVESENPLHYDFVLDYQTGNFWGPWDAYRNRNQANLSVSHHAEDFLGGSHDFKFGVEWERSPSRTYARPAGKDVEGNWASYYDYDGEPYAKGILTEYDVRPINKRLAAYVQDSWSIGEKLVINPGIRFNIWRGELEGDPLGRGNVFQPKLGIAPRLGITYDVFGDNSTALKFHYGKYYHPFINFIYSWMGERESAYEYIIGSVMNMWSEEEFEESGEHIEGYPFPEDEWVLDFVDVWNSTKFEMSKDINFPYVNQFTVGVERAINADLSVAVNYIYRSNHDLLDMVLTNGEFESTQWTDNEGSNPTGQTFDVWEVTSDTDDHIYRIYNPKEGDFNGLVGYTPYAKYSGIEFVLNKRFSNRWQMQASYLYGKAWGTSSNEHDSDGDNSFANSYAFSFDRNLQTNIDGRLTYDATHMVKIQGSVLLPLDISLGTVFVFSSGMPYARNARTDVRDRGDRVWLKTTETGAYRLPDVFLLDLRVEKIFNLGRVRLSPMMDIANVFNSGTVTNVVSSDWSGSERPFQDPQDIVSPRRFRLGIRLTF